VALEFPAETAVMVAMLHFSLTVVMAVTAEPAEPMESPVAMVAMAETLAIPVS